MLCGFRHKRLRRHNLSWYLYCSLKMLNDKNFASYRCLKAMKKVTFKIPRYQIQCPQFFFL